MDKREKKSQGYRHDQVAAPLPLLYVRSRALSLIDFSLAGSGRAYSSLAKLAPRTGAKRPADPRFFSGGVLSYVLFLWFCLWKAKATLR